MSNNTIQENQAFYKVWEGLWKSLQRHLQELYQVSDEFVKSVPFSETYPFDEAQISPEELEKFKLSRVKFRDWFIDEVEQLDILLKAIRAKKYSAEEKKSLFLILLGYSDILESLFRGYREKFSSNSKADLELEGKLEAFDKLQKVLRFSIRGM